MDFLFLGAAALMALAMFGLIVACDKLGARVAQRRGQRANGSSGSLNTFGDVTVDFATRRVERAGAAVHLTPIEYRLLGVLIANAGRVLTHRALLREVWGPAHSESTHYLRGLHGATAPETGGRSGAAAPHPDRNRGRLPIAGRLRRAAQSRCAAASARRSQPPSGRSEPKKESGATVSRCAIRWRASSMSRKARTSWRRMPLHSASWAIVM